MMRRWIYILPVAAFGLLAFFLFRSLWSPPPQVIPSALLNKPVPRLVLPPLDARSPAFTPAYLASGHVSVVNVFASWCAPCRVEALHAPVAVAACGALHTLVVSEESGQLLTCG